MINRCDDRFSVYNVFVSLNKSIHLKISIAVCFDPTHEKSAKTRRTNRKEEKKQMENAEKNKA